MIKQHEIETFVSQTLNSDWRASGVPIDSSGRRRAAILSSRQGMSIFVKYSEGPLALEKMKLEYEALVTLSNIKGVSTPKLIGVTGNKNDAALIMEVVQPKVPTKEDWISLADMIAALHKHTSGQYGLYTDNFIGDFPQINTSHRDVWLDFFILNRVRPMLDRVTKLKLLSATEISEVEKVLINAQSITKGYDDKASLLHGDLWLNNTIMGVDGPVLIDPAINYGSREVDIAFSRMLPHLSFPKSVYDRYNQVFPLPDGYKNREKFWQLWPLLTHLVQDGDKYLPLFRSTIAYYLTSLRT